MKIAFVYDAVYPWVKGGAEKRIYELGRRLTGQGHEVHLFGVKWWDGAPVIRYEGMVLHGVCEPMQLYVHGRRSITEAVFFSIKLFPHLLRWKFDLIDASAFPYFSCFSVKLVSVLRRIPMVITWHEVWGNYWYEYLGIKGFFGKLVERLVSKLPSKSIAVSSSTGKRLRSIGVAARNVSVIPNGIDLKKIAGVHPSIENCDVIFVGRLIREKNADVLLEAVKDVKNEFPDIKCHIIGDGPEKERLVKLTYELGLLDNVKFLGFREYNDVISRLKSAKILVLPSAREGFGIVVIEAFACGMPVVTINSDLNAASLLVSANTGFRVDLDAHEISNAVRKLITDESLRQRMSLSAFDVASEYDWGKILKLLICSYEEVFQKA